MKVSEEFTCPRHKLQLVEHEGFLICLDCEDDRAAKLRGTIKRLGELLKEERRLRKGAQVVIGKQAIQIDDLIEKQWKDDATIQSLELVIENLRTGK